MRRFPLRLLLLLLPALLVLPWAGQFAFPVQAGFTDLAVSHYPNAVFLRDAILRYHQIPLWSPLILSGYPFVANPLSGLVYPPGWLALLFPLPFGFNLLVVLHGLLGGIGMYRWLRAENLALNPALFGALAFQLLPRVFAHYAAGHLTLTYAIAWTPWLLLAAHKRVFSARGGRFFTEGLLLGLIGLADLRWLALAGLLWAAYRLCLFFARREPVLPWLASGLSQPVLAVLLVAPLLLPLLEYTRVSTRASLSAAENLVLSLPPVRLLSLFSPSLDGNTEWTVYAGGVVLALSSWAFGHRALRRRVGFWMGAALLSLLLALGSNLPLVSLLYRLPGFDLLRVPSRFVILAGFSLVVIAACTLNDLAAPGHAGEKTAFWSRLLLAGAAAFTALAAAGAWLVSRQPPLNFLWGAGAIGLSAALLFLRDRERIPAGVWIGLLILLNTVDMAGINLVNTHHRSGAQVLSEGQESAAFLASQPGVFRVFTNSYSQQQQVAARYRLEMANGTDPLQLFDYAKFIERASGVPAQGYSVVLPPVTAGDLAHGNAAFLPDARLLGWLNVKYILSEDDLKVEGLRQIQQFSETRIYQNDLALPRAWVQPAEAPNGVGAVPVVLLTMTPNRIDLTASGPGRLVLSELAYPGWQAVVDGQPKPVETCAGLFRSVLLPEGKHTVSFSFRPRSLYLGLAVFALGLLVWLSSVLFARREVTRATR